MELPVGVERDKNHGAPQQAASTAANPRRNFAQAMGSSAVYSASQVPTFPATAVVAFGEAQRRERGRHASTGRGGALTLTGDWLQEPFGDTDLTVLVPHRGKSVDRVGHAAASSSQQDKIKPTLRSESVGMLQGCPKQPGPKSNRSYTTVRHVTNRHAQSCSLEF
jgi:hypothetical protein